MPHTRFLLLCLPPLLALVTPPLHAQEVPPPDAPDPQQPQSTSQESLVQDAQTAEEADPPDWIQSPAPSLGTAFGANIWQALPLEFEVFGRNERDRLDVPGLAFALDEDDLSRTAPRKTEEALRLLPGLHALEIDTMGIRPHISGLSGTNPVGSDQVLILEDGIPLHPIFSPIQIAPYMTNAARIQRVEWLQGGYGVLQPMGSLTGTLNLVTLQPPQAFETQAYIQGGSFGRLHWGAHAGDLQGAVGYMFEVHRREFDGPFDLNLQSLDLAGKFRLQMSERAWFDANVSIYTETAQPRVIGLTQSLALTQPRPAPLAQDREELDRWSLNLSHTFAFAQVAILQTSAWAQRYTWNRRHQQVDRDVQPGVPYERIFDADNIPNAGDLYFRDATDVQDLQTTVFGAQSQVNLDFPLGNLGRSELVLGARASFEDHTLEQRQGSQSTSPAGSSTGYEELSSNALATYTAARLFFLGNALRLFGGSRLEAISLQQSIWRTPYNPTLLQEDLDPTLEVDDNTWTLLPGAGISWDALDSLILFASVKRSMTPADLSYPSGPSGERLNAPPTFAWRYEAGPKLPLADWFSLESAAFLFDTEDLPLPTQDVRIARPVDTRHFGAMALLTADLARPLRLPFRLPLRAHYTWTRSELQDAPEVDTNFSAYSPEHRAGAQIGFEHPLGFEVSSTALYVSGQNAAENLLGEDEQSGAQGPIDAQVLWDARIAYSHLPWGITTYVLGKNLLDDQRVVARQRGIQLGGIREFIGGVEGTF